MTGAASNRQIRRAFEKMQATSREAAELSRAGRNAAALNAAERAARECVELCRMDPLYRPALIVVLHNAAVLSRLNEDVLSWLHYAARAVVTAYDAEEATGQMPAEAEQAFTAFEQTTFLMAFGQGSDLMRESLATVLDGSSPERRSEALETIDLCLRIGDRHRRSGAVEAAIGHYTAAAVLSDECHELGPPFVAADCAAWMSLAEARVATTDYRQGGRESASRACARALNSLGEWFRVSDVGLIFTPVHELPAGADLMRRCTLAGDMLVRYSGVLDTLGHEAESVSMEVAGRLLLEGLDRPERMEVDISREMSVERFNAVEAGFSERP
ncbi:hypothetical protein [Nucisporomicrobium flavum]|uniref:hypothetical protein n=1 Tax=Nucisporomicrobium flavum TaxID=2785915 RepID=UPI0018F50331|nr:hypothetical protein [Nucisporomicrobium flavum]